jgi:pimeloyl-ACP methyl ester carboxylesterase
MTLLPEGARDGFVVANGIRVYYVEQGQGPLVLLCHGFPEFWYSWRHQIGPLAEAGFHAVAVDLPGYGRSDKPDRSYDVQWLTACLSEAIEGLGHERAVLAGHDWGGLLVWPFARMHPHRTAGVIGINTPDLPRTPIPTTEFLRQMDSSNTRYILEFQERGKAEAAFEADPHAFLDLIYVGPACKKKEAFTQEVLDVYHSVFEPKGAITPPLEYYRNMDRNWELIEPYDDATIDLPSLMICAADDPVLHPGLTGGMEQRVPKVELVTIEDCGHWTQQEQPAATTEHMLRYLRSLDPWP